MSEREWSRPPNAALIMKSARSNGIRTCCGCAAKRPQHELVPLHADVSCTLVVGRAPGRGAWVCPDEACVAAMIARRGLLSRSLRARVNPPDGLWQAVQSAAGGAASP
jgi:predicted RNA-binding protein YlxR (DUF448 family)